MPNVTRLENGATFRASIFYHSLVKGGAPVIPILLHILYERPQFIHVPNLFIHADVRTFGAGSHAVAFWAFYGFEVGVFLTISSSHLEILRIIFYGECLSAFRADKLDGFWLGFLYFSPLLQKLINSVINQNGQHPDKHPDNV